MKMGSAHAKPLLPMGCKADTLGIGLSGLSSASRGTAEARRAPALAKKPCTRKTWRASLPALQRYLGVRCTPPNLPWELRAGELRHGSHTFATWRWHGPSPVPGGAELPSSLSEVCSMFPCPWGKARCSRERRGEELCLVWPSPPTHIPTKVVVRGVLRAALLL